MKLKVVLKYPIMFYLPIKQERNFLSSKSNFDAIKKSNSRKKRHQLISNTFHFFKKPPHRILPTQSTKFPTRERKNTNSPAKRKSQNHHLKILPSARQRKLNDGRTIGARAAALLFFPPPRRLPSSSSRSFSPPPTGGRSELYTRPRAAVAAAVVL